MSSLDFLHADELLSDEERAVRDRVRAFVDARVLPVINDLWERAEFPAELFGEIAGLHVCGGTIQGYGCPGASHLSNGLVEAELSRGDGGLATAWSVSSGLVMQSIHHCGSEEQRERWLPALARMEKVGAFALTEAEAGSDAGSLQTRATRTPSGDYLLNGTKRWIGNATFADVLVVWARDEAGKIAGFLVEKGSPGLEARPIGGKLAKRTVINADLTFTDCAVPAENRLTKVSSFKDLTRVLREVRLAVAFQAYGHALGCVEIARDYALGREQFGKPIAAFQLIQSKLVGMVADLTSMRLLLGRVSTLADEGRMSDGHASLAKLTCAAKARAIAGTAREILGGNGVLLENHVARHMADLEAVYTYEGTHEINTLVVGRELTGERAFT